MPGAGFIGAGSARHRGRSGENGAKSIAATVLPASSALVVGETLGDTVNWAVFTAPANYATAAPGETIAGVQVNYIGDVGSATEPLADGDTNAFSVTVTDTAGTARTFSTVPRIVVHSPPLVSGPLADQTLTGATGLQSYDASGAFSGLDLGFAVDGPAGVAIDAATGAISFDTEVLAVQSGTPVTVTARNSGGTAEAGFALSVQAPVVYSAAIAGLTDNPTHGLTAQIGTPLTGTIANLIGSETVQHRWTDANGVIAGADAASFTPRPAQDLDLLRYAPLVNGDEVASAARTVRHAPPVAGSLVPVSAEQGGGAVQVDLAAGFTGDALIYAEAVSWASIVGSTLTIDDAVRSAAVTITATNSGGTATVDLSVTISAPVAAVVSPIPDQSFQQGSGEVTFDLRTVFEKATGYSVTGPGASIDPDGSTLRLSDASVVTDGTITVTGSNAYNDAQDVFMVSVTAIPATTDFLLTIETTTPNESFTLPFRNGGTYSGFVDMGDGSGEQPFSAYNDAAFTAIYATPGVHTIRVSGQAYAPLFAGHPDRTKLRTVENFGRLSWGRMLQAFDGCTGMTSFTAGNCDTSAADNWFAAFRNCRNMVTCDVSGMSVAGATNLQNGWSDCSSLTFIDTSTWNTGNVTRMDECFFGCDNLAAPDISGFNLESLLPRNGGDQRGMFNFINPPIALDQSVYDAFLTNIDGQALASGLFLGLSTSPYTTGGAVEAIRADLIGNRGIFIEDAGNAAPDQMSAPSPTVDGPAQITVTLAADPFTNGLPITSRDLRYSTDLVNWTTRSDVVSPVVLTGLEADAPHYIQTRASNFNGTGAWSVSATATTTAGAQPFAATRTGTDLVLTDMPDISPQTFTAAAQGADLVITFTGAIYTPAPTQLAIIDAANHDGTNPDAGSYDVRIFDLGVGVNHVYTLAGVSVPAGTMAVLLHPETGIVGGGFEAFERVVFIGASIMAQTFGSSLTQRNATAEAAFAANGAAVQVYAHATSGFDAGQVQALLSEAMTTFPDKTLFFVHAGGNNVTANRPYPGGEAALTDQLNGLIDIAAARPGSVILSDLTFRDYGDTTAANELVGSKPYNDAIYLPAFQARQADLLPRAYYANGTPVSCLYEWSWETRESYLSTDNIHPANPGGRNLLRDWLAARLAPICLGLPAPAQFTRTLPPPAPGIDVFVEYGVGTAAGVNTPAVASIAGSGQTAEGPFALLNTDGSDPGVSLTLNFSAPAPGNNAGFGINTVGNGDGAAGFDGTLYNDVFTGDSYFAGAAYTLDHVISGLAANTAYTVELVASRNATDTRETRYSFADGQTATIQTTADPTQAPVTVDTVSDGSGTITVTQSAVSGSWSYLGGLHITTT